MKDTITLPSEVEGKEWDQKMDVHIWQGELSRVSPRILNSRSFIDYLAVLHSDGYFPSPTTSDGSCNQVEVKGLQVEISVRVSYDTFYSVTNPKKFVKIQSILKTITYSYQQ